MIGIIDIDMGNLRSVAKAVWSLGLDPVMVRDPAALADTSHCILPGVGMFRTASDRLVASGLRDALRDYAFDGRPLLGICLGMQLLADDGDEGGGSPGLGVIPGRVTRLEPGGELRVPHVGWNTVALRRAHPLFAAVLPKRDFYFVHSFAFRAGGDDVLGETEHGATFTSVVARASTVGVQFHPEKSQANGLRLLESFCAWDGSC